MTVDILGLMKEKRKCRNSAQLCEEIQRTTDTAVKEAKSVSKHDIQNLRKFKEAFYNNRKKR